MRCQHYVHTLSVSPELAFDHSNRTHVLDFYVIQLYNSIVAILFLYHSLLTVLNVNVAIPLLGVYETAEGLLLQSR